MGTRLLGVGGVHHYRVFVMWLFVFECFSLSLICSGCRIYGAKGTGGGRNCLCSCMSIYILCRTSHMIDGGEQ